MPRCALLIEYDGTNYAGWQRQINALAVQEVIERAVESIVGAAVGVIGSGRTDAGVHGFGQVAHADLPDSCSIPAHSLAKAFNSVLPPDVRIRAAAFVESSFHARFHAIEREYRYTVLRRYSVFQRNSAWFPHRPFSPDALNEAAAAFVGEWDFTTFSKHNPDTESYICRVQTARWTPKQNDDGENSAWRFQIIADRFVYGMVRSIVGACMDVAVGKRSAAELREALKCKDRALASPLAPPNGLTLWRVEYERNPFLSSF
jgi:tRNA pseudouridine38-40 synthase